MIAQGAATEFGGSWQALVDVLVAKGTLRTPRIIQAFRETPRSSFVPPEVAEAAATVDMALAIGEGQTVSQPTTVAIMLELVAPRPGEKVLDIGTGSGWQAALLARIVGSEGRVYTVERVSTLARAAQERFQAYDIRSITALVGDASRGLPSSAPYDVIIAAAESASIAPELIDQLAPGGRLLQPIARMGLRVVRKDPEGKTTTEDIPGFVFVPLVESGEEPKTV